MALVHNNTNRLITIKHRHTFGDVSPFDHRAIRASCIKLNLYAGTNSVNDEQWDMVKEGSYVKELIELGELSSGESVQKKAAPQTKAAKETKKPSKKAEKAEPEVSVQVPGE